MKNLLNQEQKGAVDLIFIAVLVVLLAAGGFVLWRVQSAAETVSETGTNTDGSSEVASGEEAQNPDESGEQLADPYAKYVKDEEKDNEDIPEGLISLLSDSVKTTTESCADVDPPLEKHPEQVVHDIVDGKYASVVGTGCTEASGLGNLYALDDNEWILVGSRVGPLCTELEKYDFPSTIVFNDGALGSCRDESMNFVDYPR